LSHTPTLVFVFETGSHYVPQAGLELLDSPASSSQVPGTTGTHPFTWPNHLSSPFFFFPLVVHGFFALARQMFYHLSHTSSPPQYLLSWINYSDFLKIFLFGKKIQFIGKLQE
jgi:hypothetical protein